MGGSERDFVVVSASREGNLIFLGTLDRTVRQENDSELHQPLASLDEIPYVLCVTVRLNGNCVVP